MGHVRLIPLLACATVLVALSAPASALAGTYTWSLPGDPGIFAGSNPEQKYNANSWTYSAVPITPLPNGEYTAVAEQDDPAGAQNYSSPVTFVPDNVGPSLTLDSLGSTPLLTSTPTFTGIAGTRQTDNTSVAVAIWSGSSISGPAMAEVAGSVGANAKFSIQSSSLPDGRYTAVVAQLGAGLVGFSNPVTFRIKVHPPALTVSHPAAGGSIRHSSVYFSGHAGDALGDSSTISFALFRGSRARGKAVGKRTIHVKGPSWSVGWRRKLKNGFYTLRATQTDDAGHTTKITHTFLVIPGRVRAALSHAGTLSATRSLKLGS